MTEVEPWATCPRCGSQRYHLLGDRTEEQTGNIVKRVALAGSPPRAEFRPVTGATPVSGPPNWRVVEAPETRELIDRECLACSYRWQEATGRKGAGPSSI